FSFGIAKKLALVNEGCQTAYLLRSIPTPCERSHRDESEDPKEPGPSPEVQHVVTECRDTTPNQGASSVDPDGFDVDLRTLLFVLRIVAAQEADVMLELVLDRFLELVLPVEIAVVFPGSAKCPVKYGNFAMPRRVHVIAWMRGYVASEKRVAT